MLTPEKYERLKVKLASGKNYSPEARAMAEEALAEYEAEVESLKSQVDPSLPIAPQVLSAAPATAHPKGDEAAADEWARGSIENPNGLVVFYETPSRTVRQKLLESPELARFITDGKGLTAEEIAGIQPGDSLYQAFNDAEWNRVAGEAVKGGKTPYRYSKAPWMNGGAGASLLDTLSTKLKHGIQPALEGATAFVMGHDNTANFGLVQSGAERTGLGFGGELPAEDQAQLRAKYGTQAGQDSKPLFASNDETRGGMSGITNLQERADVAAEENPGSHLVGELAGALNPRGLANKLFGAVYGGAGKLATAESGIAKRALAGAMGLAGGGAATQVAAEGVNAANNLADTGETGTTLADAGTRVAGAAGGSLAFGALPAVAQGAARVVGKFVREGQRYKQLPALVEKLNDGKVRVGEGHVEPQAVKSARLEGAARDIPVRGTDVIAEKLDEPLRKATAKHVADVEGEGDVIRRMHYGTPEGQVKLQANNVVKTSLERLRALTSDVGKKKTAVGMPRADHPVVDAFNTNIENVTRKQGKSSVAISAKEARSFLSAEWQKKVKLDKLPDDAPVYVTPRRYTSEGADQALRQFAGSADEDMQAIHKAALKDRKSRAFGGAKGDYSKLNEGIDESVAKAKDLQKRAAPDEPRGGYKAVVKAARQRSGESQDLEALQKAARLAGGEAPELLKAARVAGPFEELREFSHFGNPGGVGNVRSPLGLSAISDAMLLRGIYPMTRKLEKLPAELGKAGNIERVNDRDEEREQRTRKRDEPARVEYERKAQKTEDEKPKKKRTPRRIKRRRSEATAD